MTERTLQARKPRRIYVREWDLQLTLSGQQHSQLIDALKFFHNARSS